MLDEIGDKKNIPAFIKEVKGGGGRLMGFGHRVYKSYDPRAKLIKRVADDVFGETGLNPKLEIAMELERIALEDEYFIKRKLYPNVDFYSGLIYQAMGYPTEYFTVLFALGRMPGWLAQWEEMLLDKDQKIARPRQIYTGERSGRSCRSRSGEPVTDQIEALLSERRRFPTPWSLRRAPRPRRRDGRPDDTLTVDVAAHEVGPQLRDEVGDVGRHERPAGRRRLTATTPNAAAPRRRA